ncbi:SecY-interacting protein [Affinibrenneria salicis]|uniref:Protein Syd n=1 Tax=Affinibrenneria salicis TaxID=2590031 RepID=A0A5J5FRY8_9GAMM|nr:SecY-interacting protein [Affinibrenneria salicis]KAA8996090.1 SecY-interacting protein [Affinibrenneria salicis]
MDKQVKQALYDFTQRYIAHWRQETGHPPASADLYGVPSPCIVETLEHKVRWLPQPASLGDALSGVERALDIALHPAIHSFYSVQYAGDMQARFGDIDCSLLQVWSDDDLVRMQENLIGHLLTQKRLKLPPTLFLATTGSEMTLISLSNVTGKVVLEEFGTRRQQPLADSLADFLSALTPLAD